MKQRAAAGFSSATALAEAIQTRSDSKLSYRTAHRIVARAVLLAVEQAKDATGINAALLDQAATDVIGRPLGLDDQTISKCLDPARFIAQHAVTGGTAPTEVQRMAAQRLEQLQSEEASIRTTEERLVTSRAKLRTAVSALLA